MPNNGMTDTHPRKDSTVYYITTKTQAGPLRILETAEKREFARLRARELDGTVRTQAEIDALGGVAKIPGHVAPETIAAAPVVDAPVVDAPVVDAPVVDAPVVDTPPAAGRWNDLAQSIAAAHKKSNTVGKKEKVLKRPPTDAAVLEQAAAFLRGEVFASASKVHIVRALANWTADTGAKLQRKDALTLLATSHPDISAATVSTQWQLVRSGKLQPV